MNGVATSSHTANMSMSKPRRNPSLHPPREPSSKPDPTTMKASSFGKKWGYGRSSLSRKPSTNLVVTIVASLALLLTFTQSSLTMCAHPRQRIVERVLKTVEVDDDAPFNLIDTLERWKEPQYAKQRLSIYVYDLPSRFNADLVKASHVSPSHIRDPYCDTNFYSSEVHVHRFLLNSSVRTTDPFTANYFYVPVYTTCDLINNQPNDLERTGHNFRDAMRYVMTDYPFWNSSNGRDHIFLFAQGFSARLAGDWMSIKNSIFMVHNGEFTASEYTPHKDFTIPPELRSYFQPVWRAKQPGDSSEKRYLAQFGGQVVSQGIADHRGSNYSHGVRQFIKNYLTTDPEYRITGVRSTTYLQDMKQSTFCLAPEGWHPWSPRPYYSVQMGCIPVIISEVQELAFEEIVNWDSFAVWVRPHQIEQIDTILHNISPEDIEKKRAAMKSIQRVLWYDGEDALGYQAILQALYTRKLLNHPRRIFSTVEVDDY